MSLEDRDYLLSYLQPGSRVHTILRHVSPSGMTRWISVVIPHDDGILDISMRTATVTGRRYGSRGHDGVEMGGCGMDMGFALVYDLSRSLWPKGFPCIGERCPSNDHSNGHRDYTPGNIIHPEGGYALRHSWL